MCGRFVMTSPAQAIAETFSATGRPNVAASYNVAPTQSVAIIRKGRMGREANETSDRILDTASWGFLPRWAKSRAEQAKMINARAETVAEKPAFRHAYQRDRILVPVSGFYEWQRDGEVKQPFYIHPTQADFFAVAGLRTVWRDPESGEEIATCCLLTIGPNGVMAPIHHRMPVILSGHEAWQSWLAGPTERANDLMIPSPDDTMKAYPVDRRVGRVAENDRALIDPIVTDPSVDPLQPPGPPAQGSLL